MVYGVVGVVERATLHLLFETSHSRLPLPARRASSVEDRPTTNPWHGRFSPPVPRYE
jgi:hypothetical protein